ncbi:MAG: nucleotidyltransferase domain-containing protein [Candidatus Pacebacteria bacterium]|nr:nucleotidyltransferase domain-containing protein [Candidatus Paceibacterota bacterium]
MAQKKISKKTIKIIGGFVERLKDEERLPIERVVVFGSRANGKAKTASDIDVCLISPRFQKPLEAMKFLWQKRNRAEVLAGLEPIGFSAKDFEEGGSLISEIKKTGVRVL